MGNTLYSHRLPIQWYEHEPGLWLNLARMSRIEIYEWGGIREARLRDELGVEWQSRRRAQVDALEAVLKVEGISYPEDEGPEAD